MTSCTQTPQETAKADWGVEEGVLEEGGLAWRREKAPIVSPAGHGPHPLPSADPTSLFPSRENTGLRKRLSLRNPSTWSPSGTEAQPRQQLPWASEQEGKRANT